MTDLDTDRLRRHVAVSVRPRSAPGSAGRRLRPCSVGPHLATGDFADGATFDRLAKLLGELVGAHGLAVRHLAVPPGLFGTVADGLATARLAERAQLAVRSPSAATWPPPGAERAVRRHFDEDRLFRVDHFLGKEPVEDLLVLRFANRRALFYGAGKGLPPPNRIRLRLQPDAGVTFAVCCSATVWCGSPAC